MKEGKSTYRVYGNTTVVCIPQVVYGDTAFPFVAGQKVIVTIDNDRLIIESLKGVKLAKRNKRK